MSVWQNILQAPIVLDVAGVFSTRFGKDGTGLESFRAKLPIKCYINKRRVWYTNLESMVIVLVSVITKANT